MCPPPYSKILILRIDFGNRPRVTTLIEPLVCCSCFANRENIIPHLNLKDNSFLMNLIHQKIVDLTNDLL